MSSKRDLEKLKRDIDLLRRRRRKPEIPVDPVEFFHSQPYGRHELYRAKISEADLSKLTKLIQIAGQMLQTKVYLFWEKRSKKT